MTSVTDVLANCGVLIPEDCSNNVDGKCILKVTLDCFQQMIANAGQKGLLQHGGGAGPEFKGLVQYIVTHNLYPATASSIVPDVLARKPGTELKKSHPLFENVALGDLMTPKGIKALNKEVKTYLDQLQL